jgi:hypothetical protein
MIKMHCEDGDKEIILLGFPKDTGCMRVVVDYDDVDHNVVWNATADMVHVLNEHYFPKANKKHTGL